MFLSLGDDYEMVRQREAQVSSGAKGLLRAPFFIASSFYRGSLPQGAKSAWGRDKKRGYPLEVLLAAPRIKNKASSQAFEWYFICTLLSSFEVEGEGGMRFLVGDLTSMV